MFLFFSLPILKVMLSGNSLSTVPSSSTSPRQTLDAAVIMNDGAIWVFLHRLPVP